MKLIWTTKQAIWQADLVKNHAFYKKSASIDHLPSKKDIIQCKVVEMSPRHAFCTVMTPKDFGPPHTVQLKRQAACFLSTYFFYTYKTALLAVTRELAIKLESEYGFMKYDLGLRWPSEINIEDQGELSCLQMLPESADTVILAARRIKAYYKELKSLD